MGESGAVGTQKRPWKRWLLWLLAALGVVLAVAAAGFVIWGLTPLGPAPEALAAMKSDSRVVFVDADDGLTFAPASGSPTVGIVFYPGGHVDYRSYSTLARDLAAEGYLVVVPPMPLSLAVLAPNRADRVISAHPEVARWVLMGHSLGGAMACTYASSHPEAGEALALLAAYPAGGADLSNTPLAVVSLLGTRDTVVSRSTWDAAKPCFRPRRRTRRSRAGITRSSGRMARSREICPRPSRRPGNGPRQSTPWCDRSRRNPSSDCACGSDPRRTGGFSALRTTCAIPSEQIHASGALAMSSELPLSGLRLDWDEKGARGRTMGKEGGHRWVRRSAVCGGRCL